MTCFWCGKPLGFFHAPIIVGGIPREMHTGWLRNCTVEYKKWHDQPKKEDARLTLSH